MRKSHLTRLLLCFCFVTLSLNAQTTAGAIVGTVTDPSGAIIAGATVTITNMGTNIAVKTTIGRVRRVCGHAVGGRQVFGSC